MTSSGVTSLDFLYKSNDFSSLPFFGTKSIGVNGGTIKESRSTSSKCGELEKIPELDVLPSDDFPNKMLKITGSDLVTDILNGERRHNTTKATR